MLNDDRKFDWKPNHDPRSLAYPVIQTADAPSVHMSKHWGLPAPVLDQGNEGACVGHGVTNGLRARPVNLRLPAPGMTAKGMYYGSRYIDEWPGESYDGTSVNAGCKLAVSLGFASGYRWAFGAEQVAQAVLDHGPVVIGIHWDTKMYSTLDNGLVDIGGQVVGGHCLLVTGFERRAGIPKGQSAPGYIGPCFQWANSWGASYGLNGYGYIPFANMDDLLSREGEAAVLYKIGADVPADAAVSA